MADAKAPKGMEWYYRPGTTEPELRPKTAPEGEEAEGEEEAPAELKGRLPEDFPGHAALEAEGLTTYAKVRKQLDSITEVPGIGDATAERIREAMSASPEEEEE